MLGLLDLYINLIYVILRGFGEHNSKSAVSALDSKPLSIINKIEDNSTLYLPKTIDSESTLLTQLFQCLRKGQILYSQN